MNSENYKELLQKIEEFYDKVGPKYELIYPNFKTNNAEIAKSIIATIPLQNNAKVADLGCGSGWLLNELSELNPGLRLFGFDISKESIDYARNHFGKLHPSIHFEVADWLEIKNTNDCCFDLAMCLGNSLTHFPIEIQNIILLYFSDVVKPGGYLLIDCYKSWNEKLNDEFHFEPKGLTRTQTEDIISCFFSAYKKNIAIRNICFAHYTKDIEANASPSNIEHYITYQFPFVINDTTIATSIGFSELKKIILKDDLGIFDYYLLKK